jgi:hypothetical protein
MSQDTNHISDNTSVAMPIRNIISIVGAVAVSTWAYSGVIERLNRIETQQGIEQSAIELNSEFRINWPRGTMGSLPADAEQNREIQAIQLEIERIMEEVEENDTWIDNFEPPKEVQQNIDDVSEMKIKIALMRAELTRLENHVFEFHK